MKGDKKVLLGRCAVDSGQIMLVDPCYVLQQDEYTGVCEAHRDSGDGLGGQFVAKGHADGVVTSTGFGDGVYPVYATIRDCGDWGKRVASVTIMFLDAYNFLEPDKN